MGEGDLWVGGDLLGAEEHDGACGVEEGHYRKTANSCMACGRGFMEGLRGALGLK